MIESIKTLMKEQRIRLILVVAGVTVLIISICVLAISLGQKAPKEGTITVSESSDVSMAQMSASPIFCKSILSTKRSDNLDGNNAIIISDNRSYQEYLQEYDDITVTYPEQVPLVDDWFAAGYVAIVYATDKYGYKANLIATASYQDDSGNIKIPISAVDINPQFTYSQSIDLCKQTSVVIFLSKETVADAHNIEILIP